MKSQEFKERQVAFKTEVINEIKSMLHRKNIRTIEFKESCKLHSDDAENYMHEVVVGLDLDNGSVFTDFTNDVLFENVEIDVLIWAVEQIENEKYEETEFRGWWNMQANK